MSHFQKERGSQKLSFRPTTMRDNILNYLLKGGIAITSSAAVIQGMGKEYTMMRRSRLAAVYIMILIATRKNPRSMEKF